MTASYIIIESLAFKNASTPTPKPPDTLMVAALEYASVAAVMPIIVSNFIIVFGLYVG